MPTTITFRRGTSAPTSVSGLTLGEPAFDSSLKRFFVGQGTGVTAVWVGAQISGLSSDIAAGLTYQVPTMSAVKDYVASTTSGVATLNNLTGAVTIVGGSNIGVTTATGSITVTNTGVQSFNGNTGAVTGASLGANTFTGLNTFNSGITTAFIYASTGSTFAGTVQVSGGATLASTVDVTGVARFAGGVTFSGTINGATATFSRLTTHTAGLCAAGATVSGNISFLGTASKSIYTTQAPLTISGTSSGPVALPTNSIVFGVQSSDSLTLTSTTGIVDISTNHPTLPLQPALRFNTDDKDTIGAGSIKVEPNGYATGNRTQYLQDASGTLALTSQLMGAVNGSTAATTAVTSFNGNTGAVQGVSSAAAGTGISVSGATGAVTITNTGVHSFNGNTGAVQGVSAAVAGSFITVSSATGSVTITNTGVHSFNGNTGAVTGASLGANTFTGLNTFNAGVTTSFLYASTGSTFGSTLQVNGGATFASTTDHTGVARFASGVTFASTTDHTGAARFASTITSTGAVTANGGLTASTVDVSGAARLASTLAVTGVLTQSGGATFASTTDHTGAARFASTVTATGAVTANGGLTASTLDVSGTARTTGDVTVGATLTVNGNFFVAGTVTTVNRTDLNIDDKTITMGRTLGSDALADGGGLVLKGSSDRTWTWSTSGYWQSSQGVNVATGSGYSVNGTSVLTSSTLGSGITTSSLQAVGTVSTGTWQATAIGATYGGTGRTTYTIGDILFANGTSSLTVLGASTAGRLLAANGTGTAPEYKQLIVNDGGGSSIATITSGTGTLTAAIQYATSTLKGVASFDSEMFTVTSGAVTLTKIDGGTY